MKASGGGRKPQRAAGGISAWLSPAPGEGGPLPHRTAPLLRRAQPKPPADFSTG